LPSTPLFECRGGKNEYPFVGVALRPSDSGARTNVPVVGEAKSFVPFWNLNLALWADQTILIPIEFVIGLDNSGDSIFKASDNITDKTVLIIKGSGVFRCSTFHLFVDIQPLYSECPGAFFFYDTRDLPPEK